MTIIKRQLSLFSTDMLDINLLRNNFEEIKKNLQKIYKSLHFSVITVVTDENRHIYPQLIDDLLKFETNQININLFRYGTLDHPPLPSETIQKYKEAVGYFQKAVELDPNFILAKNNLKWALNLLKSN